MIANSVCPQYSERVRWPLAAATIPSNILRPVSAMLSLPSGIVPAFTSMFTGQYAVTHGIVSHGGMRYLPLEAPCLPERKWVRGKKHNPGMIQCRTMACRVQ